MITRMQEVLEDALQLSPVEQLALIRKLSESLQVQYQETVDQSSEAEPHKIPSSVKRTKPATDIEDYVADFWPNEESIDELNAYIRQQRAADRLSDQ